MRALSSRLVYENPWLRLREDQVERDDGSRGVYSVVEKPDFALVIPMSDDGFHLVEQYRYAIGRRSWEFPSGNFPAGVTGTPAELAAAELAEETGLVAGALERLGYVHTSNGASDEGCHVFLATELVAGEPRREASEQDMRQEWFPRAELERMLRAGEITDGPTMAAYLLLRI